MKRMMAFSSRNLKELVRDPLSYIFCIGFPLVMLGLMTIINSAIPAEAQMTLFHIDKLTPGIALFGLSFIMLFATLEVSKDRCGAFLIRLFSSPMTPADFIGGYALPLIPVILAQFAVTFITGAVIGAATGITFCFLNVLLTCAVLLPCAAFFVAVGIFFGTLMNDKAGPPCSSVIISLCGVLGGIWFDLESIPSDNILSVLCRIFPFSHATVAARAALSGNFDAISVPLLITIAWAAGAWILALIVFRLKMKSETK